jgi:UDP-N-acetylmuramyl pentapeptide phosphotransferase/UDP-N-acetylglucosamine-1-phosphate transferase
MMTYNFAANMLLGVPVIDLVFSASISLMLTYIYYIIALKLNIVDQPGGRSSHINTTVTGAGMVFTLSLLVSHIVFDLQLPPYFILGLLIMVVVSFLDDMIHIRNSIRFVFQLLCISMLIYAIPQWAVPQLSGNLPIFFAALIFGVFVINGLNFMDGINGMLGSGGLVVLLSMAVINSTLPEPFVEPMVIFSLIASTVCFLLLNLRTKALAFMGDTGSVGLGFALLYLMYSLIAATGDIYYLLLFAIYGIDSGLTVVFKLILRENIFIPHRDFLFKKLVHVGKYGHVRISIIYACIQTAINVVVIVIPHDISLLNQIALMFIMVAFLTGMYIRSRNRLTKSRILPLKVTHKNTKNPMIDKVKAGGSAVGQSNR